MKKFEIDELLKRPFASLKINENMILSKCRDFESYTDIILLFIRFDDYSLIYYINSRNYRGIKKEIKKRLKNSINYYLMKEKINISNYKIKKIIATFLTFIITTFIIETEGI